MNNKISKLSDTANAVVEMHKNHRAAIAGASKATEDLIKEIVKAISGALPAISSRIPKSETHFFSNGQGKVTFDFSDYRGCKVKGDGPRRSSPHAPEGRYEGTDLYILEDGSFMTATWGGQWNRARERNTATADLSACDIAKEATGRIDEIIAGLEWAFEDQIEGRMPKRTESLRRQADLIQAIALLLKRD